jgi:nicotinamidase-related amidase
LQPRSSEAVIDKITMSAFEGTPLDIVLRDCGVRACLIVGVALAVGIEPTARHSADLGYVPVIVRDACGAGDRPAAQRTLDASHSPAARCSPTQRRSAQRSFKRRSARRSDRGQRRRLLR